MPIEDYVRNVKAVNVVDGDTIDLDIDLGFHAWILNRRVRLLGVNCPEKHGPTKEAGLAAKKATADWLAARPVGLVAKTHLDKTDSFGRVLAEVWSGEESLAEYLLKNGFAVPFMT